MGDVWREEKLRSQLLTRLKCIGPCMLFVKGERRRTMMISDALLEKYRLDFTDRGSP